jgi:hypothetical protein
MSLVRPEGGAAAALAREAWQQSLIAVVAIRRC